MVPRPRILRWLVALTLLAGLLAFLAVGAFILNCTGGEDVTIEWVR